GASHQDGNHREVTLEGCLDLNPYKITRVVQAALPGTVGDPQPVMTDDRQEDLTGANGLAQLLPKISPERDRIDVLENVLSPETADEAVTNAASHIGGISTAIRDEDLVHDPRSGCKCSGAASPNHTRAAHPVPCDGYSIRWGGCPAGCPALGC